MPLYKYSFDFGKIHTIEANIRQVLYTQGKQVYQFPLALKFAVNAEFLSKTFGSEIIGNKRMVRLRRFSMYGFLSQHSYSVDLNILLRTCTI